MRNTWGGDCYKCGLWVKAGTGHFEKYRKGWRVQHGLHAGQGRVTCDEAARMAVKELEEDSLKTADRNSTTNGD